MAAPLGAVTEITYDDHGRAFRERRATGYPAEPWQTTTTTYTATGKVASVADAAGDTLSYGYDALDRQASRSDPLGGNRGHTTK